MVYLIIFLEKFTIYDIEYRSVVMKNPFIYFSCMISQKIQSFYLLSFWGYLCYMIKCKKRIFFNKIIFSTIHLLSSKSYLRYSVEKLLLCNIDLECNEEILQVATHLNDHQRVRIMKMKF